MTEFAEKVRHQIANGLREHRLALAAIAGRMGVSPRTLQRRLNARGQNFETLVIEVRLAQAREHLRDPELNIMQIALQLGYRDISSFDRAFGRVMGISPNAWSRRESSAGPAK